MALETDEQIATRKQRDKALRKAWLQFKATADKKTRRKLAKLPHRLR